MRNFVRQYRQMVHFEFCLKSGYQTAVAVAYINDLVERDKKR